MCDFYLTAQFCSHKSKIISGSISIGAIKPNKTAKMNGKWNCVYSFYRQKLFICVIFMRADYKPN